MPRSSGRVFSVKVDKRHRKWETHVRVRTNYYLKTIIYLKKKDLQKYHIFPFSIINIEKTNHDDGLV